MSGGGDEGGRPPSWPVALVQIVLILAVAAICISAFIFLD